MEEIYIYWENVILILFGMMFFQIGRGIWPLQVLGLVCILVGFVDMV